MPRVDIGERVILFYIYICVICCLGLVLRLAFALDIFLE